MNGLIKIKDLQRPHDFLNGRFARVHDHDKRTQKLVIQLDPVSAKVLGCSQYSLSIKKVDYISDGKSVLSSSLNLLAWPMLNIDEKADAVNVVLSGLKREWYENFENIITKGNGPEFLDAFILETTFRRETHNRYGAKAIFEELRFHTYLKDESSEFKINNNYTSSMSLLVSKLFPEIGGFFTRRPNHLNEVAA